MVDISLILLCMESEQLECRISDLLKIFLPRGKTVSSKNETVGKFPSSFFVSTWQNIDIKPSFFSFVS